MTAPEFNQEERELLQRTKSALLAEREARGAAQRVAFLNSVKARLAESDAPPEATAGRKPHFSSKKRYWFLAAAVFLGLLGVMAMMTDMFSADSESHWRRVRIKADKAPLPRTAPVASDPAMLADLAQQNLVLLIYEHHGESCLWLYPQRLVRPSKDPHEQEEFQRRKKWFARVDDGRVAIPAEALAEAFGTANDLIIMRVDHHLEVWSESALARYFANTGKQD